MNENQYIKVIALPDGTSMAFEQCLENLKFTRDFDLYLDMLYVLKDRYMIILSIKGTSVQKISDISLKKIHALGFSNYTAEHRMMYVGAANKGEVICNSVSAKADQPVDFECTAENTSFFVSSGENTSEIIVDKDSWSMDDTGLNFAVYDCEKSEIVDISCYDASVKHPLFFHRNLYFTDKYLDSHIYMPQKFMANLTLPIKRSYFSNRQLDVREVERGIVLPRKITGGKTYGGVCDENFNFIAGHQTINHEESLDRHIYDAYSVPPENIDYVDETVVYGGNMFNHPGHLILECFADRVWWYVRNADSDLKVALTTTWNTNNLWSSVKDSFIKEFLYALGISQDRIIIVEKATKFKKIIIPDQSAIPLVAYPYDFTCGYTQVYQHITKDLSPTKYKKVYLTKSHTARKNIIGEDYFLNFYKQRGFEIINPEEYTIKEKAEIMYGADEVVTIDGTNGLFAVFCKPSVKLTILTRMHDYWNSCQQLMNEAAGIKEFYLVNVSGSFFISSFSQGLSLLCVTEEFKRYVKDVFNEELDITPEESMKQCLYEFLSYFPKYYSNPQYFNQVKNLKMLDILGDISYVFNREDFDTSNLDLSTTESNLQNQVKDLNAKKNALTAQVNALTEENKALKSAKAQNETELARLHADQNKPNAELSDARRQKDEADKKIAALYQQKDEVYQKLLEACQQKDEIGRKLLSVIEEKSALIADISVKNHRIDTLVSEKDKLAVNASAKESELLTAADKVHSLESALANANARLQSYEQECAELRNKISWIESTRSWRCTKPFRKKKKES